MDEDVSQLIENINEVITANGNEEITGDILNSILNQIVSVFYGITGDKQYLTTFDKTNLVSAINEVFDLLSQVNTIKLFSGTQDPNTFDVNGGEYEVRDFYMQTSTLGTIALWIYTGVIGVEWLNLTDKESDVIFVANLPITGKVSKLYTRTSDNTLWRWTNGGVFPYPTPQFIRLSPLEVHTHSFVYDGDNNVRTLEHPIHEVIDLMIDNGCNFDQYVEPFTPGATQITIKPTDLLEGQKIKLIYK